MSESFFALLDVSVDFDTSQWFFPKIVLTLMALLLAVIFILDKDKIISNVKTLLKFKESNKNTNITKIVLSVVLLIVYFLSMEWLGELFPNTGYGFLIASIPFMFVLSLFYLPKVEKNEIIAVSINSIMSPVIAWYTLGVVFGITLP
ncbi:tripartite tricarboxylate transporter TctB family protein [Photobacterium sagamiensis]|uniref:tripartite tricarboxylate transporter TctB family protein n=1 Tax=Photobacterium sagamiensis TaxID=2910241 RepID=UPI003D1331E6